MGRKEAAAMAADGEEPEGTRRRLGAERRRTRTAVPGAGAEAEPGGGCRGRSGG